MKYEELNYIFKICCGMNQDKTIKHNANLAKDIKITKFESLFQEEGMNNR